MQLYEPSRLVFLWTIPLLILVFAGGAWEWNRRLGRLGNAPFLQQRLMPGFSLGMRKLGWGLLVVVFLLSTTALARPQWGEEKKKVERKGVDLIFLLDTSLSMLAEDVKPSRLGKSKLEIKNLIRRLKGDRVGMVAFAGSSFLQCPLTLDYSAFLLFVDALRVGYIPNPGTSLSRALELAVRAFPEESRKYRAVILFSDGEDHEGGVREAVEIAKKAGVRIYTVGVGTVEGEPIPLRAAGTGKLSGYKKDREDQVVITRLNPDLLGEIARETGGVYLPATPSEKEADVILKHLETLEKRQLKERLITEREDHFQIFLLAALLLLVWETLLGSRRRRGVPLAFPLLAFFVFSGFIDTPRSLVQKGNRLVEEKKYQSAVEKYRKAEVARPDEPVIRYNLGTALYQLYQYRDAEKELEQALARAKDAATQAKTFYNYGNAKYRLGDFEKAIEAYKKTLDLNPKDVDAKYNLEFLQKKKSQFEKKNEERQKQPQKQKPQQSQQQQKQNQPEPQPKPQEKEGGGEQQPQPQGGSQEKEQEKAQGEGGQGEQAKGPTGEGKKGEERKEQKEEQPGGQEEKPEQQRGEKQEEMTPSAAKPGEKEKEQAAGKEERAQAPFQGQMSVENALRVLNALREGEKQLQDIRRPPAQPESREVAKDW